MGFLVRKICNERRLDIVVEVKWKQTDTIIVIHVEPQSYQQSDFNKRMFHYFSLLHQKVDKPILPIAIFSYDEAWDEDTFTVEIDRKSTRLNSSHVAIS